MNYIDNNLPWTFSNYASSFKENINFYFLFYSIPKDILNHVINDLEIFVNKVAAEVNNPSPQEAKSKKKKGKGKKSKTNGNIFSSVSLYKYM